MKIETEEQRTNALILGAQSIESHIKRDPRIIKRGYDQLVRFSNSVDKALRGRMSESQLADVSVELHDGVVEPLRFVAGVLENLASGNYDPHEVAWALSNCSATLNYLKTRYAV